MAAPLALLLPTLTRVRVRTAVSRLIYAHNRSCYLRQIPSTLPGLQYSYQVPAGHMHSSSVLPSKKKKVVPGVNDCPQNCLCSNNIEGDYKNVRLLSQFVSSQTGTILPRTITKVCMSKQREITKAIKRARTMGFMPYTEKTLEYVNDPKLF